MAEWWEEYTAQPAAQPASQDGNWWDAYAPVPDEPRPLMASVMPERTGEEALSDTATRIRQGLNSVVGGIVGAPVDLANFMITPPHQRAINKALGVLTDDIQQP